MNDTELIDYCDLHAETERALFHASHIKRMFELAECEVPKVVLQSPGGFFSMHESMKKLVSEARERIRKPKLTLVP
jgi:hypothetical protein